MKFYAKSIIALSLILMLVACAPKLENNSPITVIENATLIDAQNGLRKNMDVILQGDTIESVGQNLTDEIEASIVTLIDGTGKFLIPGLWDAHVHLTYTPGLDHETFFPLSIAHGVTSLRDTGGHLNLLAPAQAAAKADDTSPDLYISGPLIDGTLRVYDGQRPSNPDISIGAATPEDGIKIVDQLVDAGVDFIKAYEMLDSETFGAITERAKFHGLPVSAHSPLSMTAQEASNSGVGDMQHLRNLEMSCAENIDGLKLERQTMIAQNSADHPSVLRRSIHSSQRLSSVQSEDPETCNTLISILAKNNTIQTPTLTITRFLTKPVFSDLEYRKSFDLVPTKIAEGWKKRSAPFMEMNPDKNAILYDAWVMGMIKRLLEAGVPIMAGTDAPIGFLTPGASLHEELFMLVDAGLSPLDAIEAATVTPARFFGLENQMGNISPGMKADLVLLNANPLDDIRNISSVDSVIKNGHLLDRKKLNVLLETPRNLAP